MQNLLENFQISVFHFVVFVISSVVIFVLFKLVVHFIDYLLFKKLVLSVVDQLIDEEDEENLTKDKLPNSQAEDDLLHKRDKEKEKVVEVEILNNFDENKKQQFTRKVVGISNEKKIFGKWTALVMKRLMGKFQHLDLKDVQEFGINVAQENARARMSGKQVGGGRSF